MYNDHFSVIFDKDSSLYQLDLKSRVFVIFSIVAITYITFKVIFN